MQRAGNSQIHERRAEEAAEEGGGGGGGRPKMSSAKVQVKPLVDLPSLRQPPPNSYWTAGT